MSSFYHLYLLLIPPFLLASIIGLTFYQPLFLSLAHISLLLLFYIFASSTNSSFSTFTSCIRQHSNIYPAPCAFTILASCNFTLSHHINILLGLFYHSDNKPLLAILQIHM